MNWHERTTLEPWGIVVKQSAGVNADTLMPYSNEGVVKIKWGSGMEKKRQKILCVCQGGNSRSVHLAYLLKYRYGADALNCGWEGNSPATLTLLCEWAEFIILVQESMREKIAEEFRHKVRVFDVGPDRFFTPNVELLALFDAMIQTNIKASNGD